jgi:hypothetical protein
MEVGVVEVEFLEEVLVEDLAEEVGGVGNNNSFDFTFFELVVLISHCARCPFYPLS